MNHKTLQDLPRPTLGSLVFGYWRQLRDWKVYLMLGIILLNMFGSVKLFIWANVLAGAVTDSLLSMKWENIFPVLVSSVVAGLSIGALTITSIAMQELIDLRFSGVTPDVPRSLYQAGRRNLTRDDLIKLRSGVGSD